ncbi:MAG: DUF3108 domain-containing protein [Hyphomonadaceae bacterium]
MHRSLRIAALACALLGAGVAASAAQEERVFTAAYTVHIGPLQGDFDLRFAVRGERYEATATRRSRGLARTLVGDKQDYRYAANGAVAATRLLPAAYEHQGGRRNRLVKVAFDGAAVTTTASPAMSLGEPPASAAQKEGAIDFLSFFVAAALAPGADQPCQRTLRVFDGRALFDMALAPAGREKVSTPAWSGQAYRCSVQYTPIAGYRDPVKPATLTFLFAPRQDGVFAPLRIEMPTEDAGVVRLEARKFTVTGST